MCRILISDIDSARHRILIRHGKGAKDRYVPLSPAVLEELRRYYAEERPPAPYLFPGRKRDRPFLTRSFYIYLRRVSEHVGFEPHATPHQLRHAYASHQLELGVDIHLLQLLLGHANPGTTERNVTLTEEVMR